MLCCATKDFTCCQQLTLAVDPQNHLHSIDYYLNFFNLNEQVSSCTTTLTLQTSNDLKQVAYTSILLL